MTNRRILFLGVWLCAMAFDGEVCLPAQETPQVRLEVQLSGPQTVVLSWFNATPGFLLQETDSIGGGQPWRGLAETTQPPGVDQDVSVSITPDSRGARFYRLAPRGVVSALDYLLSHQQDDGSWSGRDGSWFRDTAAAIEGILSLQGDNVAFWPALSALAGAPHRNNDDLARKCLALAAAGQDVAESVAELRRTQNSESSNEDAPAYPDRAWGLADGYGSTPLDTALGLRAVVAAGQPTGLALVRETVAVGGVSPPRIVEVPDGATQLQLVVRSVVGGQVMVELTPPSASSSHLFTFSPGTVIKVVNVSPNEAGLWTVRLTNLATAPVECTAEFSFLAPDGSDGFALTTPLIFLGQVQNGDGGWGIAPQGASHLMATTEVMLCLAALRNSLGSDAPLAKAAAWLRAHCSKPGGGFGSEGEPENVYETALAMRALHAADPRASLHSAARYLRAAQLSDGSWGGNAAITALAIQALELPPVLSPIPAQSTLATNGFAPIRLDDYVTDPDHTDAEIAWQVFGNTLLSVAVSNRIAFVTFGNPDAIDKDTTEEVTFIATDPDGHWAATTATFTVRAIPKPPVVSKIPSQTVEFPASFDPINLDDFVVDPDHSDDEIRWRVTGNTLITVTIIDRIATLTYRPITNFTEHLTFTATDPDGLAASTNATFSVGLCDADYTVARGGSVTGSRRFSAPPEAIDRAVGVVLGAKNEPPGIKYQMLDPQVVSPTEIEVLFRILADATALTGCHEFQVEHLLLDDKDQPLGPLTGNVFNLRIRVTP